MKFNFWESILAGLVLVLIIIPTGKSALANGNINVNGLILDFINSVERAVQRNVPEPTGDES